MKKNETSPGELNISLEKPEAEFSEGKAKRLTLEQLYKEEARQKKKELRDKCEAYACEKYGQNQVINWSNANAGLWYMPVLDEVTEEITKMLILRPLDRTTLSYAQDKAATGGTSELVATCMRQTYIAGEKELIEDDIYFIPLMPHYQEIVNGVKVGFVKR